METTSETPTLVTSQDRFTGRVKWFNNQSGFGFITVTDGPRAGSDIFAHHSGVKVSTEQYKYLVQGEYVQFNLNHVTGGQHEYQACDVSGINGGKLMCETRHEFKQARNNYKGSSNDGDDEVYEEPSARVPRSLKPPTEKRSVSPVKKSRSAPRNAQKEEGKEWTLVGDKKPATRKPRAPKDSA